MPEPENNTRVAIIGCGFVGAAVGKALVELGCDVIGTTTTSSRASELKALGVRPVILDVSQTQRLAEVLADRQVAYLTVAPKQRGADYRSVYLMGARALVEAAGESSLRRIIYTSSTRVYGESGGQWVDESTPAQPADENGRVLLEAEAALLQGGNKPDRARCVTIVRLAGVYGRERDPLERIRSRADMERNDGEVYLNLIHIDDVVGALVRLLQVNHHGVLNLADDLPTKRRAYYDRVLSESHLPPIRWTNADAASPRGKRIRNELIKRTLGMTLQHPRH